jgi:hypothetical protein
MSDKPYIRPNDYQIGGTHYVGAQPWDVFDTWSQVEQEAAYKAHLIPYAMRLGRKGTRDDMKTDLRKIIHYCEKLIEVMEQNDGIS